jgi:hypothetical protein
MFIKRKSKKAPKQAGDPVLADAIKALALIVAGDKLGSLASKKEAQAEPKAAADELAKLAPKPAAEYSIAFEKRLSGRSTLKWIWHLLWSEG